MIFLCHRPHSPTTSDTCLTFWSLIGNYRNRIQRKNQMFVSKEKKNRSEVAIATGDAIYKLVPNYCFPTIDFTLFATFMLVLWKAETTKYIKINEFITPFNLQREIFNKFNSDSICVIQFMGKQPLKWFLWFKHYIKLFSMDFILEYKWKKNILNDNLLLIKFYA